MTLWSARNGYLGSGQVAALVEADTEAEAREIAVAAFAHQIHGDPLYAAELDEYCKVDSIVRFVLPYVGDELP